MFSNFRKKRLQVDLEHIRAMHRVELFERDAKWKIDLEKKELELNRLKEDLIKDSDIKIRELTSVLKLDYEQRLAQAKIDFKVQSDAIKLAAKEEIATFKESELAKTYERLSAGLTKLHEEGNAATKFTQEIALRMFEAAPQHKSQIKVITTGKQSAKQ